MEGEPNNNYSQFKKYYHNIGPMFEKPKARIYTTTIFSFLAVSLFSWYAIKPTVQTILYLRREIADKTVLDQKMEAKISNLIEAQAVYDEAKDKLMVITEAIPDDPEALDSVLQLKNMISTTEATISSLSVAPVPLFSKSDISEKVQRATNKSVSHEYAINMVLTGTYTELEKCLTGFATMRRLLTIDSFGFTPDNSERSTKNKNGTNLKLTLQLKSYYK